jgi:glucose-6-phosphate 1-dehydrogenase
MMGDPTLFQRADMVEAGWSVVQPILDVWTALPPRDFPNYAAGSWGPEAAAELLHRDGREWRDPLRKRGAVSGKNAASPVATKGATANS